MITAIILESLESWYISLNGLYINLSSKLHVYALSNRYESYEIEIHDSEFSTAYRKYTLNNDRAKQKNNQRLNKFLANKYKRDSAPVIVGCGYPIQDKPEDVFIEFTPKVLEDLIQIGWKACQELNLQDRDYPAIHAPIDEYIKFSVDAKKFVHKYGVPSHNLSRHWTEHGRSDIRQKNEVYVDEIVRSAICLYQSWKRAEHIDLARNPRNSYYREDVKIFQTLIVHSDGERHISTMVDDSLWAARYYLIALFSRALGNGIMRGCSWCHAPFYTEGKNKTCSRDECKRNRWNVNKRKTRMNKE